MKVKKIEIKAFYHLDDGYIPFPDNPLDGKSYENVEVTFEKDCLIVGGTSYRVDVIKIEGQEPIECELLSKRKTSDGTLEIRLCQDWG